MVANLTHLLAHFCICLSESMHAELYLFGRVLDTTVVVVAEVEEIDEDGPTRIHKKQSVSE